MAQPPAFPDSGNSDQEPERDARTPRWMAALGVLIAAVVVALLVYLHLAGIVGPGAH